MEAEIQVIENFIKLIKTQPDLFSEQDRNEIEAIFNPLINTGLLFYEQDENEIEAIINSLGNDDLEGLADKIDNWCTVHEVIGDALNFLIASEPIGEMGLAGTFSTRETKTEDEKNQRETLDNEVRKSSTEETKKPNTPKG
ncbi:hypothetical protein BJP34_22300 [Moorena producens PAL-8-15-08-1]|uniref:Uncharacterized protein n=1 Tax=Moorena producens PAL-8-15-08-1 TaxID=1458985 RepID=A0A1D8TVX9_9CYAN|nr:hypothetical protein [Moorena producens]AOX01799.1 hypothetical protein BJP34_22300 [Moorena producens PAL-8-15-08-1]